MATKEKLIATLREGTGKGVNRKLRASGRVSAVLYGREFAPMHLTVDAKSALRLINHHGSHAMFEVEIEGAKKGENVHDVLMREVQKDPQKDSLIHLDLYRVGMDDIIQRTVPIHLNGEPIGLKVGGILQHGVYEVSLKGPVRDIPESVEVDITPLVPGDIIRVNDVKLPKGVRPTMSGTEIVAGVLLPRGKGAAAAEALEELTGGGEAAPAEPELIGRSSEEE